MNFEQIGIDGLRPFYNQLIKDGLKITFDEFLRQVKNLSPSFINNFGESINIYNTGWHWSSVDSIMIDTAKSFNGYIPSRTGLQKLIQALISDVTIESTDFLKIGSVAISASKDVAIDVAESGTIVAENLGSVLKVLPFIAIGLVIVYVYYRSKK